MRVRRAQARLSVDPLWGGRHEGAGELSAGLEQHCGSRGRVHGGVLQTRGTVRGKIVGQVGLHQRRGPALRNEIAQLRMQFPKPLLVLAQELGFLEVLPLDDSLQSIVCEAREKGLQVVVQKDLHVLNQNVQRVLHDNSHHLVDRRQRGSLWCESFEPALFLERVSGHEVGRGIETSLLFFAVLDLLSLLQIPQAIPQDLEKNGEWRVEWRGDSGGEEEERKER